jgi:hypothetical protein
MTDLVRAIIAFIVIAIIALAVSANKDGAKLVQAGIIIAIVVVVLRNSSTIQTSIRGLTNAVTTTPKPSSSSGGN